jgi:amino acid transporter
MCAETALPLKTERRTDTQPVTRIRGDPHPAASRRSLGLWMATALVIGNMIGSGVFLLPASLAGATLTLWAFIGLESATIPAEEVADPERTIPRATIIAGRFGGASTPPREISCTPFYRKVYKSCR